MVRPDEGTAALTPEEGWSTIHQTLDRTRNSMYVAGTTTILFLWGALVTIGFGSQYAVQTLASDFATDRPWYPGPDRTRIPNTPHTRHRHNRRTVITATAATSSTQPEPANQGTTPDCLTPLRRRDPEGSDLPRPEHHPPPPRALTTIPPGPDGISFPNNRDSPI